MSNPQHQIEIDTEQRYLDRVYARLAELRRSVAEAEKAGYSLARVGTFGAYVERDAMVYHAARRRRALDAEYEGLVFGRLDLLPPADRSADRSADRPTDGQPERAIAAVTPAVPGGEVRYIGRLGLRDEAHESMVVDWRAPAAAAFYRATPADRMGVVRRRTIRSSGERVIEVEDDLLDPERAPDDMPVIGEGSLIAALSRATGHGMRDIVATIQREQDEAIRAPASGVTVVRGGPGTGKTAVALHRAAYLLYADRNRFESGGVLVIGPSEVFVEYVGRVLPSLGEDAVALRSLGQLVEGVHATRRDPAALAAAKGSPRMVRVLSRAARGRAPGAPDRLRVLHRGQLLQLDRPALDQVRRTVLGGSAKRNAVRAKAAGYLLDALWRQSLQVLPGYRQQKRNEFAEEIAERREFRVFMRDWWPVVTPMQALGWLGDRARLLRYAEGGIDQKTAGELADSWRALAGAGPSVADVALLDELDELLGSPPVPARRRQDPFTVAEGVREVTTLADRLAAARAVAVARPDDYRDYAHVVVDEAQDVSPMQWRMIGRRGRHASWTVVGDPAQAAWPDPAEAARAMDQALGSRRRHEYTLGTNYRNPAEIFAVAAAVIRRADPAITLPRAVRPGGAEPRHLTVAPDELASAVRVATDAMLAEVAGTVGVITPTGRRAEVAGWLCPGPDRRVQVVGSLDAKGMEYDGVVVVDATGILAESGSGVRTLYVALSRATHRLVTVGSDDSWVPATTGGVPG